MNTRSLQASFWLMIAIQTIGSVDVPGAGARKLPSPRQYVAIVVAWLALFLASDVTDGAARGAAALGWLMVLAGMVAGPFGTRAVSFMRTVATGFAITPPTATGASATATPGQAVQV